MIESSFDVVYRVSQADFIRAMRAHCLRSMGLGVAVVLLFVLLVSVALLGAEAIAPFIAGALAGGLIMLLYLFVLIPRRVRTIHREQRSANEEKRLRVNSEGLQIDQDSGVFRVQWGDLIKWMETSSTLAVYVNRVMFIPLPKQALGEPCVCFIRDRVIASGLPHQGKLRRT